MTNKSNLDLSVPTFPRGVWPKRSPALSADQLEIARDFMHYWQTVLPQKYRALEKFNHEYPLRQLPEVSEAKTLEIGAGLGEHLHYENKKNQMYFCNEIRADFAATIERNYSDVRTIVGDCQEKLPVEDNFFDRVIAIHVLEHLNNLPIALDEIHRTMKPGGFFNIVIPCDPGFMYELARKFSTERIFKKRYKLPYRWWIRREHINSPSEILAELSSRFRILDKTFFPFVLPLVHLNICIGVTGMKV